MKSKFRSFEDARKFVRTLNLKGDREWREYCKSDNKPKDIPSNPNSVYKNKGWISNGDFFGTFSVADKFKRELWWTFEKSRKFVHELNFKNRYDWYEYCQSPKKSKHIPSNPNQVYKKEWKGIGDWLGNGVPVGRQKYIRSFEDARKFVHTLKIKTSKEWFEYCKSGKLPKDIPNVPRSAYKKEWNGMSDWLDNGLRPRYRKFCSFEDARKFVRGLKLKSATEWGKYCKSGDKPEDIPRDCNHTYYTKWKGWGDFLGTGNISPGSQKFRSFEDARKFVHTLQINTSKEWFEYCKSGNKPEDIPQSVQLIYKKEWKGWGDFLGNGNISSRNHKFSSFEDARKFVHTLQIKSQQDWFKYCKSGEKPKDIPQDVANQYKDKGWAGYGDWLGTGRQATRTATYLTFEKCKTFAKSLKLSGQTEWVKYCKSGNKPNDVPSSPWKVYKNKGWTNMGDFFGTGNVYKMEWMSFKDARNFVHTLKISGKNAWDEYCKSGNKPDNIPSSPRKAYKNKGWVSNGDWLGTGTLSPKLISENYLAFNEARIKMRELAKKYNIKNTMDWKLFVKSGNKPDNIPADPRRIYKKK